MPELCSPRKPPGPRVLPILRAVFDAAGRCKALDPQQFSKRKQPCSLPAFPGAPRFIIFSSCFVLSPLLRCLSSVLCKKKNLGTSYIIWYISVLVPADLGLVCALQRLAPAAGCAEPSWGTEGEGASLWMGGRLQEKTMLLI